MTSDTNFPRSTIRGRFFGLSVVDETPQRGRRNGANAAGSHRPPGCLRVAAQGGRVLGSDVGVCPPQAEHGFTPQPGETSDMVGAVLQLVFGVESTFVPAHAEHVVENHGCATGT